MPERFPAFLMIVSALKPSVLNTNPSSFDDLGASSHPAGRFSLHTHFSERWRPAEQRAPDV